MKNAQERRSVTRVSSNSLRVISALFAVFAVPYVHATNPDCWVRLHVSEDRGTTDAVDTIQGPGQFNTMVNLPGATKTDWTDAVNSLEMGPAARGFFWEYPDFTEDMLEFGPGRAVDRLDEFDFDEEIESMKIECVE